MSSESPDVVLYDINGNVMSVANATAIPASTSALMVAGTDGTNSRYFSLNTSGQLIITGSGSTGTPATGIITIQGNAGGVAVPVSGTVAATQSTSPWVDNVTQFGGTNLSTGTGASGAGIPRVTVSNDSNILATQSGTWTNTVTQATAANLLAEVGGFAANAAAIVGNPVLMAGWDGTDVRTLGSVPDRAAMTAGSQNANPIMGQSYGVGRIIRVNHMGTMVSGNQTLLALDVVEGSTVNSWLWAQSTSTMTITQATGIMTLNAGASTTASTYAIITSNKQFQFINQAPLGCSFKALVTQTTNAFNELGFGAPTTTTAIINNGAFFRIDTSGSIFAVTSNNGTETVSASLGTIVTTTYYIFDIWIQDGGARFIIESETGIPLVDYTASLPLATPDVISAVSHLPCFARVYITSSAAGAAPQTKIANFQAWQNDIDMSKPWSEQLACTGRSANISPTAFTQTTNCSTSAAPTAVTPTSTAVSFAKLGGDYALIMTATSGNLLGVHGFTVPSPYSLYITEIFIPPPIVSVAFSTTLTVLEWVLAIGSAADPATATYFYPLGIFGVSTASAAAGTSFNGQAISLSLKTPIVVLSGQVVMTCVRIINGAATGDYTGTVFINGHYE